MEVELDFLDREFGEVQVVEPINGDAMVFEALPPEGGLSTGCNFPVVGHGWG
jgi:hypothetical protein